MADKNDKTEQTPRQQQALEVARHLLEGLKSVKDMLYKDTITGYKMVMLFERPDGSTYTLTQYDAVNVVELLGAVHLAVAEFQNVCLNQVHQGLPDDDETEYQETKDRPRGLH